MLGDTLALTEKALFRVGWLLDACGIKWSQKVFELPLGKLEGKTIGVLVYDDEYNKKISSKVSEYYSEEEVDELLENASSSSEDEEDLDDEDEDEDEDDDDDDDDDEDDEDEL